MGLKTTNYTVSDIGITIPNAYARVTNINVGLDGAATAIMEIQQTRSDVGSKPALSIEMVRCDIDKDLPLFEQIYEAAKLDKFNEWDDDIVEEVIVPEEEPVEEPNTEE
jgi:hypothetical protein